jgi:transposase
LAEHCGEQRHEVRLIPAQYVKPYVKTNKSDYIDAEAIAEAVARPTMRFVPIKTYIKPMNEKSPGTIKICNHYSEIRKCSISRMKSLIESESAGTMRGNHQ